MKNTEKILEFYGIETMSILSEKSFDSVLYIYYKDKREKIIRGQYDISRYLKNIESHYLNHRRNEQLRNIL
jgi:hypothetical protein